jgi:hypothetical protein
MVTGLELHDPGTNLLHHPGAIRHGDASIDTRHPPRHHTEIVEVQGGGMHTHADGGRSGFAEVHQLQAVEPLLRMSLDSFHSGTGIRAVD